MRITDYPIALFGDLLEGGRDQLSAIYKNDLKLALAKARFFLDDGQAVLEDGESEDGNMEASGASDHSRTDQIGGLADSLCDHSLELMQIAELFDSPFLRGNFKEPLVPAHLEGKELLNADASFLGHGETAPTIDHTQNTPAADHTNADLVLEESRELSSLSCYCYGMVRYPSPNPSYE